MSDSTTTITLRALEGTPLIHEALRDMVIATAKAIGERQGVGVNHIEAFDDRIVVTVAAGRLAAIGLIAELRRQTTRWYEHKFGVAVLWGPAPDDPDEQDDSGNDIDDADWWKS